MLPLYKEVKILEFDSFIQKTISIFMWKITKGLAPVSFSNAFLLKNIRTDKDVVKFQLPTINTNYKKRFVAYSGVLVWNNLPIELRIEKRFPVFKSKVNKYYLDLL